MMQASCSCFSFRYRAGTYKAKYSMVSQKQECSKNKMCRQIDILASPVIDFAQERVVARPQMPRYVFPINEWRVSQNCIKATDRRLKRLRKFQRPMKRFSM